MKMHLTAVTLLLFLLPLSSSHAELFGVSGTPDPATDVVGPAGEPGAVSVSLAHGFPLWYEDVTGLKLELCLDQRTETAEGSIRPCLTAEPLQDAPISFPRNFGGEAFYWSAIAVSAFASSEKGAPAAGGDLLLVLAQEASFLNDIPLDGAQTVFARIRIRINVPTPGTYRVTHPFGVRDYVVSEVSSDREIKQTQDLGAEDVGNFVISLSDASTPVAPPNYNPAENEGIVNADGRSIGPFLRPVGAEDLPASPVRDLSGNLYIANPGTEAAPNLAPITAGTGGVDYFEVALLDPPAGFLLDAEGIDGAADNTVRLSEFQVTGKIFNGGPNTAPVANPDSAATTRGNPILIDVTANDTDPVAIDPGDPFNPANPGNTNVHGIHPGAIGVVNGPDVLRTTPFETEKGATVTRTVDLVTGKAFLIYTPSFSALALGEDTFFYVVQDRGGMISAPAGITVTVENLIIDRAEYRPRIGKWRIEGTTSDNSGNSIALFGGPRAMLYGSREAPAVPSASSGAAALMISEATIDYRLVVDPLPATAITGVHIHVGAPGTNGPVIFTLFDDRDGSFAAPLEGTLTASNLQVRTAAGISTFAQAREAIRAGEAYVNIFTEGHPTGEIRGQLERPLVGTAPVEINGTWRFAGKSIAPLGLLPNVSARSSNGIGTPGFRVRLR